MTAINVTNLHLAYPGGAQVLTGANLTLAEGEILGLLGASGSGKSTLLRVIAGLQHPQTGTVEVAGVITDDDGEHVPPHRRNCTMVFQDAQCFRTVVSRAT